jgi:hypothetical protein
MKFNIKKHNRNYSFLNFTRYSCTVLCRQHNREYSGDITGIQTGNRLGGAIKAGYIYSLVFWNWYRVRVLIYKQSFFLGLPPTLSNFEVDASTSACI